MSGTPALHRVKVDNAHFNMVRRYMVDRNMRSAARAAEEMIEIAAAAAKAASNDSVPHLDSGNGEQAASPTAQRPA